MGEVLTFFLKLLLFLIQETISNLIATIFFLRKPKNISGQLALVTGGAQGLGKAIAIRLAQEKCNIAICDLNIEKALKTSEELREKYNISCEAFKADVSDTEQVAKLHNEIEQKMGTVDILVNNAGVLAPLGVLEGEDSDITRVININLTSHFWMVRKFLPSMIKQKRGHIVGISSAGGKLSIPFGTAYCASKFGANGFYKSVFDDICVYGYEKFIKITCAFPGFINTRPDLEKILDETNEYIPRIQPERAAEEIVSAMLMNKREIMFPFVYKFMLYCEFIIPTKTTAFAKTEMTKLGLENAENRMKMARI